VKDIKRVHKHYVAVDGILGTAEADAKTPTSRNKWATIRDANSQACFALLFAQFEDVVNTLCKRIVAKRKKLKKWEHRRSWDIIETSDIWRVSFMSRVALLTEKGKTDYNTVNQYYKLRCAIDHGSTASGIIVTTVANDLLGIATRMNCNV